MNAEFDWWLLLVGIVGGAGLAWLVIADFRRRDDELADDEREIEAAWIADAFDAAGRRIEASTVAEVLDLHRAYLAGPAPELDPLEQVAPALQDQETAAGSAGDTPGRGGRVAPEGSGRSATDTPAALPATPSRQPEAGALRARGWPSGDRAGAAPANPGSGPALSAPARVPGGAQRRQGQADGS